MKKGMTLVEVLVSLVILSFLLAAVFTILNLQTVKSATVRKTTIQQTDAQVALTLLKWDLATAGLAYPKSDTAILDLDGANDPDTIVLRGVGLGFEATTTKWSWLLDKASGTQALVRAFEGKDSVLNFGGGEQVVVLDRDRNILNPPGIITIVNVTPDTFVDPNNDSIPALKLDLDLSLFSIAGMVMITIDTTIYNPGLPIYVDFANRTLMRGNEVLLDNVEDLQMAYGTDSDGDEIIDTWNDFLPANTISLGRKWMIRYTLVTVSRPLGDYNYPHNQLTIENHVYTVTPAMQKQKRIFLTGLVAPPNLQP
ncbi:prepilin-type N-terminal cleavage/methylation domain-containing protein [candidate division WOR-3 bacterium]|nr:prepilin-type N-terminal cleavage/methylation domain-containing protein [candidate division WOR-3 bacterium]